MLQQTQSGCGVHKFVQSSGIHVSVQRRDWLYRSQEPKIRARDPSQLAESRTIESVGQPCNHLQVQKQTYPAVGWRRQSGF